MSAYNEIDTQYTDQQCLVEALQEMGYKPQVHEKAEKLEGYHGDKRTQTAEIIIPRHQVGGASNDVGFKRNADGTFTAIVSDFDKSGNFGTKKQQQLKKIYAEKMAMKQARAKGLRFIKKETATNKQGQPVQRLVFQTTK